MSNDKKAQCLKQIRFGFEFRISNFEIVSDFDIRNSDFSANALARQ